MYPAIDQLANHAARLRNRTRSRLSCPIVLRAPYGGGIHAPEHHSESTESMFAHIPGLRVVIPSSPSRAYGLLLAAIRDPDPVIFLEPKRIYRLVKQNMKIHWPPPGVNPALAQIYNLYWDPREDNPLLYQGIWSGTPFVRMLVQHRRMKDKWPDWEPARGIPYEDVENLRPETKKMVETWLKTYGDAKDVIHGVESAGN